MQNVNIMTKEIVIFDAIFLILCSSPIPKVIETHVAHTNITNWTITTFLIDCLFSI